MKRRTKLLLTFSAVIGLFAFLTVVPGFEAILNAARCPVANRIVYTSRREYVPPFSFEQVEAICSDGSGAVAQRLPSQLAGAAALAFSPDGNRVAFASDGGIRIMRIDGSSPILVADGLDVAWSPDGNKLAFAKIMTVSESADFVIGIFVFNASCADIPGGCISTANFLGQGRYPNWSPDGRQIAFSADDGDIYLINADGSGRTRLTNVDSGQQAYEPVWSPDGQAIAFSLFTDACPCPRPVQIYLTDTGAAVPTYLTDGTHPVWSADGRSITFISDRNGLGKSISLFDTVFPVTSLYLITRDGKNITRLTEGNNDSIYTFSWMAQ